MEIREKLFMSREELQKEGAITIVVFGDSVSHGGLVGDIYHYDTVYWNRLRNKLMAVRNYVPVNVINAAIGGTGAKESVERLPKQVLTHCPDLVIVCFGLNDVNGTKEDYLSSMRTIFEACQNSGSEVIFLTPNMLNTYVAEDVAEVHRSYAAVTAEFQNNGRMDDYIESAVALAESMGVAVCDCYSEWKKLSETQDITMLLANRINHPTREMHELFAQKLFEMILPEEAVKNIRNDDAMFRKE